MKKDNKYIFLTLEERNGDYEYTHKSIYELTDGQHATANRFVNKYVKEFYGSAAEKDGDGYFFYDGEIYVEVNSWQYINKEEYDVLRQYL